MSEPTSDTVSPSRHAHHELARELCALATWCHALGDVEKRDTAVTLAADVLHDDPVLILEAT